MSVARVGTGKAQHVKAELAYPDARAPRAGGARHGRGSRPPAAGWPGLQGVVMVESQREIPGRPSGRWPRRISPRLSALGPTTVSTKIDGPMLRVGPDAETRPQPPRGIVKETEAAYGSPQRTARGRYDVRPIVLSGGRNVAINTSIAGILQSGHFAGRWRRPSRGSRNRTFRQHSLLPIRGPSVAPPIHPTDEAARSPGRMLGPSPPHLSNVVIERLATRDRRSPGRCRSPWRSNRTPAPSVDCLGAMKGAGVRGGRVAVAATYAQR
jgi:hypothetical protein